MATLSGLLGSAGTVVTFSFSRLISVIKLRDELKKKHSELDAQPKMKELV